MAICRIVSPNRVRAASLLASSGWADGLPADHLIVSPHLAKVARATTGAASLTLDMGTAVTVQAAALLGHTIPKIVGGTPTQIWVAGNDVDSWVAPESGWLLLEQSASAVNAPIVGWFDNPETWRYWRLVVEAEAGFDLGALLLGPYWQAPWAGYARLAEDFQDYPDYNRQTRSIDFPVIQLVESEKENLLALARVHRQFESGSPWHWRSEPCLICLDAANQIAADGLNRYSIYGVFTAAPNATMNAHNRWDVSLSAEEML